MNHSVEYVARSKRLDVVAFTAFATAHPDTFVDTFSDQLVTNTWSVDDLVNDFLAAGNVRLPWVKDPNGSGMIQPGFLNDAELELVDIA